MISMKAHREGISRVKERESKPAKSFVRTLGMTAFAALVGYGESTGAIAPGYFKNSAGHAMVPSKVLGAALFHGTAYLTRGKLSAAAHAAGDTLAVAYGYAAGKQHALVAGD